MNGLAVQLALPDVALYPHTILALLEWAAGGGGLILQAGNQRAATLPALAELDPELAIEARMAARQCTWFEPAGVRKVWRIACRGVMLWVERPKPVGSEPLVAVAADILDSAAVEAVKPKKKRGARRRWKRGS